MLQKSLRDDGFVEPTLTEREQAVARLVSLGLPNKRVAAELGLQVGTVKLHLHNIYRKLRVPNRAGLIIATIVDHPL